MDSAMALQQLQNKVMDLEVKLNLLTEWISHKFADDLSIPSWLISKSPAAGLIVDDDECQLYTRPQFEKVPFKSSTYSENSDGLETIRIVDMGTILNSVDDEPIPSYARCTRQPYVCTICNRKFRTLSLLQNHKMTHCYVQITTLNSNTIQAYRQDTDEEDQVKPEYSDSESRGDDNDVMDLDFQLLEKDNQPRSIGSSRALLVTQSSSKNEAVAAGKLNGNKREKKSIGRRRKFGDFVCRVCQNSYCKDRYLKNHMRSYHPEEFKADVEERKHILQIKAALPPCNFCQQKFTLAHQPRLHLKKFHPEEYKRQMELKEMRKAVPGARCCTLCKDGKLYRTAGLLTKHRLEAHNIEPTHKLPIGKCDECNLTFQSHASQRQHDAAVHLKLRPFVCSKCGKSFAKKCSLRGHMDLHNDVKQYVCHYCSKSFQQSVGLRGHLKRHFKSETKIQCFQCGQFFVNSQVLKKHVRWVHEGLRSYNCPQCTKKFKTKIHLAYHLKTHDNPSGRKRGLNKEREALSKREPNERMEVPPV